MPRTTDRTYHTLSRRQLPLDTASFARFLIGKIVVRQTSRTILSGRIVETEAYPPGDAAGHGYRGETDRNRSLFLSRGHAYVYLAYGTSYMLNVSSDAPGVGAGVLIRAAEPLEGVATMQRNRGIDTPRDLARGPGRLATAFGIDLRLDGLDLCKVGPIWIAHDDSEPPAICVSTRIGLTKEPDRRLRFYAKGSPFVSGPKTLNR